MVPPPSPYGIYVANCQSQVKSTKVQATSHGQQVKGRGAKKRKKRMKTQEKAAH